MHTFEKLDIWQEGRVLVVEVYRSFRFCRDFSFRNQVHRAALSVPANIAEGVERNSAAEFKNFLGIAKGSAGELRTFIRIAGDLAYLEQGQIEELIDRCVRISKRIHGLIVALETRFMLKKRRGSEAGHQPQGMRKLNKGIRHDSDLGASAMPKPQPKLNLKQGCGYGPCGKMNE